MHRPHNQCNQLQQNNTNQLNFEIPKTPDSKDCKFLHSFTSSQSVNQWKIPDINGILEKEREEREYGVRIFKPFHPWQSKHTRKMRVFFWVSEGFRNYLEAGTTYELDPVASLEGYGWWGRDGRNPNCFHEVFHFLKAFVVSAADFEWS